MPCKKYQIFIFIFIFCKRNANFCYFLQWQCNLFNLLCIGNANFLILAFAIQMFCIFCIGNILFLFLALGMQIFFIFGTGNAFLKIFGIGNANFFYILHWEYKSFLFFALGMQIIFIFSIDENDTILKTFLPFKCTKLTISFCNLYLPEKHPLALDFGWPKKV